MNKHWEEKTIVRDFNLMRFLWGRIWIQSNKLGSERLILIWQIRPADGGGIALPQVPAGGQRQDLLRPRGMDIDLARQFYTTGLVKISNGKIRIKRKKDGTGLMEGREKGLNAFYQAYKLEKDLIFTCINKLKPFYYNHFNDFDSF